MFRIGNRFSFFCLLLVDGKTDIGLLIEIELLKYF